MFEFWDLEFLFNRGMTPYQLIQLRVTLAFCGLLLWLGAILVIVSIIGLQWKTQNKAR